ncbi:hypothetical protein ACRHM7_02865 [Chromohalobacter israelensis]|uniref:hypothetical protein n=1 Tax=Chromohalobacter israelensis TaxID=141390 RepID=UPI003D7A0728
MRAFTASRRDGATVALKAAGTSSPRRIRPSAAVSAGVAGCDASGVSASAAMAQATTSPARWSALSGRCTA